jgi:oligoribonuclease NrnB/cAMP/cGMP phosphodiesterase (DHH superfamily)
MKTVCIYHRVDLDGWMSAAIVKHWFIETNKPNNMVINSTEIANGGNPYKPNSLDFIGYHYGDPIPNLFEYDQIIMCDISLPKNEMSILWHTLDKKVIWLDHHISAINDNRMLVFEGIQYVNFAACELTWEYFFPNQPMPEIVRLLGRYDCFGHKGTDEEQKVLEFQYASRSKIYDYETAYRWLIQWSTIHTQSWIQTGKDIYSYLCIEAKQVYKNGFTIILQEPDYLYKNPTNKQYFNRSFICFNKERFNPINFGIDYHKDGYDGAACFWYANGMWNFSLRNDNGLVDCSMIAKHYGGGGHKGAAGFSIKDLKTIIK